MFGFLLDFPSEFDLGRFIENALNLWVRREEKKS